MNSLVFYDFIGLENDITMTIALLYDTNDIEN